MTAGILLLVLTVTRRSPRLPVRDAVRIGAVGSLLAIHWVLFYGSIKASNVSIGVVSFSTIGFFSALLEPWFERSRPRWTNLGLSLLSLAGVALIFHFDFRYRTGILLGVACAVFAALFTILSKRETRRGAPEILLFWEMTGGTILLLPLLPLCLRIFPHGGAMGARELLLFGFHRPALSAPDPGAQIGFGLHRQSELQPRTGLQHPSGHALLRRGTRTARLLLCGNFADPVFGAPAFPSRKEKKRLNFQAARHTVDRRTVFGSKQGELSCPTR